MVSPLIAIVPAAGIGRRFDGAVKKTRVDVLGSPLLIHTLRRLHGLEQVSEIIPVIHREDMDEWMDIINDQKMIKIRQVIPGGEERQDSIFNALKTLDGEALVLIHDGVRPVFPADLVQRLISGLDSFDGIIPGLPLGDTVKTVGPDGLVVTTVSRDRLWAVQTPQVFPLRVIKRAYERASADGFYATDDASLVERNGGRVKVIEGSRYNIKVTTRKDLAMVEWLLNSKEKVLI